MVNSFEPFIDAGQIRPIQTIAITSGKGGVGKSVVAANLAVAMGRNSHEVLLVDGDLEMGNIDQLLNLRAGRTIHDVLTGKNHLSEILLQGPCGVTVVPSTNGMSELQYLSQIEHAALIGLFSDLHTRADTLIVDAATGLSGSVEIFCGAVREVIVVVVDEPTALRDASATIRVLHERCRVGRFRVVANKVVSVSHGRQLYRDLTQLIDHNLDVLLEYCGSIPFDPLLKRAVCQQRSVLEVFPLSPSARAFRNLGAKVARWPQPQNACGHIEFFVERLIGTAASTRWE